MRLGLRGLILFLNQGGIWGFKGKDKFPLSTGSNFPDLAIPNWWLNPSCLKAEKKKKILAVEEERSKAGLYFWACSLPKAISLLVNILGFGDGGHRWSPWREIFLRALLKASPSSCCHWHGLEWRAKGTLSPNFRMWMSPKVYHKKFQVWELIRKKACALFKTQDV